MTSVSQFPHLFTQLKADDCWLKGMKSMILASGGGQLVFTGHGIQVCAADPARFYKNLDWRRRLQSDQTHTSKLLRGAMRLAADLDVAPDTACMVLGAAVDAERETVDQMMKEGRY